MKWKPIKTCYQVIQIKLITDKNNVIYIYAFIYYIYDNYNFF